MALINTKDHWAFLDEIEAPMWVDFIIEAKSNYQDIDDGWFQTSHPFHQCSSHQLKAAFANYSERSLSTYFDLKRPSSPKLPSSVSRSRGKHYASKKWRGERYDLSSNKQHPVKFLNGKSSWINKGSGDETKPKLSFVKSKGNSRSKKSLVSERTGNAKENDLRLISSCRGSDGSSSSVVGKTGESNTSTATCVSDQLPCQRNLEVSSQAMGHTSGLLSAVRTSLRKSCVTRQASRVETNSKNKQLRDCYTSSGKSSVELSSNAGFEGKSSTVTMVKIKEQTPDSRNVARMTETEKKEVKDSKACNAQVKVGNSRRGGITNFTKSAHQQAAKSKVQNQSQGVRALQPHAVNNQGKLTGVLKPKEKGRVCSPNSLVGAGKENAKGRVSGSQSYSGRDIFTGGMGGVHNGAKQNGPQKGKISSSSKAKPPTNVIPAFYPR